MKGVIPEGTGLVDFLSTVIRQAGRVQDVRPASSEAIAAGEQEMLDNGIVAVGDICNTTDHWIVQKALGRLLLPQFYRNMGFIEQGAPDRFAA